MIKKGGDKKMMDLMYKGGKKKVSLKQEAAILKKKGVSKGNIYRSLKKMKGNKSGDTSKSSN